MAEIKEIEKFHIFSSVYFSSAVNRKQYVNDGRKEIAFIGRSNVGKSSLINNLCGQRKLAYVSREPGKTRTINYYAIQSRRTVDEQEQRQEWYLVDLPGYGYARTSKAMRSDFAKIITDYVLKCEKMHFLFVLVDIRLEPQKIDLRFIEMLGMNGIPFGIVFTKADKLGPVAVQRNVEEYKQELHKQWEELPPVFITSSETKTGRDEILDYIESINKSMRQQQP